MSGRPVALFYQEASVPEQRCEELRIVDDVFGCLPSGVGAPVSAQAFPLVSESAHFRDEFLQLIKKQIKEGRLVVIDGMSGPFQAMPAIVLALDSDPEMAGYELLVIEREVREGQGGRAISAMDQNMTRVWRPAVH